MSVLQRAENVSVSSSTYAVPFDIPAAKLRPTGPSTITTPAVMYSQQWAPAPSITAVRPEVRTADPAPARPAANNLPAGGPPSAVVAQRSELSGAGPSA